MGVARRSSHLLIHPRSKDVQNLLEESGSRFEHDLLRLEKCFGPAERESEYYFHPHLK